VSTDQRLHPSNNYVIKIHYRKYCNILTEVSKEANHKLNNKQALESDDKVKTKTGKFSTEQSPSITIL
jgi:hypothetical protein